MLKEQTVNEKHYFEIIQLTDKNIVVSHRNLLA